MDNPLFSSNSAFHDAFVQGLNDLLRGGGLGQFILVCANANFDPAVHAVTGERLADLYGEIGERLRGALAGGRNIAEVEEDLLVFLKILAVGLDHLSATQTRRAGPWELQFNHLRSFRPKRIAARVPGALYLPFDESAFHFNKGFMQKEAFWAGHLGGRCTTLYYNKYPFAPCHCLLVPEREARLPQFLYVESHAWLWETASELGSRLDGVGFGYNSVGAFASVNHLHFQMYLKPEGFPAMSGQWRHNGGEQDYPLACQAYDEVDAAWAAVERLHEREIPYNLLYLPGRLLVFPRAKQGTYAQPAWTAGFTWHELAGGMVVFNREDYDSLDENAVSAGLAALAIRDI